MTIGFCLVNQPLHYGCSCSIAALLFRNNYLVNRDNSVFVTDNKVNALVFGFLNNGIKGRTGILLVENARVAGVKGAAIVYGFYLLRIEGHIKAVTFLRFNNDAIVPLFCSFLLELGISAVPFWYGVEVNLYNQGVFQGKINVKDSPVITSRHSIACISGI